LPVYTQPPCPFDGYLWTPGYWGFVRIHAQPNAQEQAAMHENHVQTTSEQFNDNHTASTDRNQFASTNGGHPGGNHPAAHNQPHGGGEHHR
jgi:hypothetical protein